MKTIIAMAILIVVVSMSIIKVVGTAIQDRQVAAIKQCVERGGKIEFGTVEGRRGMHRFCLIQDADRFRGELIN